MADFRLFTTQAPNSNEVDDFISRKLGLWFTVTQPGYDFVELSFWVPEQGIGVLTTALGQLWNETTGVKLAEVDFLAQPTPAPDTWMRVTIPRIPSNTTDTYLVCSYTLGAPGAYEFFAAPATFPLVNGPLTASTSRYGNGNGPEDPTHSSYDGYFFADVMVSPAETANAGTMTAGLPSIAPGLTATGETFTAATLSATAPAALASFAGTVTGGPAITGTLAATGPAGTVALDGRPPADIERVLLAWLRAHPSLTGIRFGTTRPADLPAHVPYVQLTRSGGTAALPTWRPGPVLDRAGITVQVWASPDPAAARQTCTRVLSALYAARSVTGAGVTITRVRPLSGLSALPDPDAPDDVHRTSASVLVTSR